MELHSHSYNDNLINGILITKLNWIALKHWHTLMRISISCNQKLSLDFIEYILVLNNRITQG